MRGRTEEQIVDQIKQYLENHPDACRDHIRKSLSVKTTQLEDLESKGLITLPKRIKPGMRSPTWRWYKT